MRRHMIWGVLALVVSAPLAAAPKPLAGSHPFVLSHGLFGWGDDSSGVISIIGYWGGMDSYLRSQGAVVYAPSKSPAASNAARGDELKAKVLLWMAANNYNKVHFIGHSQGGLDTRWTITYGLGSKTSTFTSLSGVHGGSPIADALAGLPGVAQSTIATIIEVFVPLVWGRNDANALAALGSLTKSGVAAFNAATPNAAGVKYYSWGGKIKRFDLIQHPLMAIIWPICMSVGNSNGYGSANDGLVPVSSARWGTYKGEPKGGLFSAGIDHLQIANTLYSGQLWYDVSGFFLTVAKNAKANQ